MRTGRLSRGLVTLGMTFALTGAGAASGLADAGGAHFSITAAFTSEVLPTGCPPVGRHITTSGTAQGTKIGAATYATDECTDFVSVPGMIDVHGRMTLTAANGDQL